MAQIVVASEKLRREMPSVLNRVQYTGESVVITRHGKAVARLVSITEAIKADAWPAVVGQRIAFPGWRANELVTVIQINGDAVEVQDDHGARTRCTFAELKPAISLSKETTENKDHGSN